jgi:hypothetical protein
MLSPLSPERNFTGATPLHNDPLGWARWVGNSWICVLFFWACHLFAFAPGLILCGKLILPLVVFSLGFPMMYIYEIFRLTKVIGQQTDSQKNAHRDA